MKYIAIGYPKIAGHTYTPGEIFDADIPSDKEERLLRLKAVRRLEEGESESSVPAKAETPKKPEAPKELEAPEAPEEPEAQEEPQDDVSEGEADDGYTEIDEDAPEVDVMDGLVPPAAEEDAPKEPETPAEPEAPKKPAKPKAAAKKTGAGRSKAK